MWLVDLIEVTVRILNVYLMRPGASTDLAFLREEITRRGNVDQKPAFGLHK